MANRVDLPPDRNIYKLNTKRHSGGIIVYVRQALIKKLNIIVEKMTILFGNGFDE